MRCHRIVVSAATLAVAVAVAACGQQERMNQPPAQAQTQPGAAGSAERPGERRGDGCGDVPNADDLRRYLREAPGKGEAGGLSGGRFEWAVTVNRSGEICAVAVSTDDATAAWPGSIGIAKAKAFTANAFSTDSAPLSTARLYTPAQPGRSLFGAGAGDPFNPACLTTPANADDTQGKVCGGVIVFGGGVPLYRGKTKVGGLGASGDTACADHEIAKRIRDSAGLNPPGGQFADDIWFTKIDGPSVYAHPLCPNTWKNGKKIGEEAPAQAY
jgi:uncharacterized protein GlcG (DUF336 family)